MPVLLQSPKALEQTGDQEPALARISALSRASMYCCNVNTPFFHKSFNSALAVFNSSLIFDIRLELVGLMPLEL